MPAGSSSGGGGGGGGGGPKAGAAHPYLLSVSLVLFQALLEGSHVTRRQLLQGLRLHMQQAKHAWQRCGLQKMHCIALKVAELAAQHSKH